MGEIAASDPVGGTCRPPEGRPANWQRERGSGWRLSEQPCSMSSRTATPTRPLRRAIADRFGIKSFEYTNIRPHHPRRSEVLPSQSREMLRTRKPNAGCNAGITHFHSTGRGPPLVPPGWTRPAGCCSSWHPAAMPRTRPDGKRVPGRRPGAHRPVRRSQRPGLGRDRAVERERLDSQDGASREIMGCLPPGSLSQAGDATRPLHRHDL